MEIDQNEPFFANHVVLLFGLILPKRSSTLWSDERKTELFGHNDVYKIWRKKGETFLLMNTVPVLKHGGRSMMLSGCFSLRGTG